MKIGVVGCAGRMGRTLVRQVAETPGCTLAGGTEMPGSPDLGKDVAVLAGLEAVNVEVTDDAKALIERADAILDFTRPDATAAHAALCAQYRTSHVIGTTGIEDPQQKAIDDAARETVIVQAANMSLGVNLLAQLTRMVAKALDEDFDIEILEMHHRHKVDAPSGTALLLGAAAAEGRGVDHDKVAARGRDGITGERKRGAIGYAVLRGGNVVGEHSVIFAADNERVELVHRATDRGIFARGAVRAALWSADKDPGRYDMNDVLGL